MWHIFVSFGELATLILCCLLKLCCHCIIAYSSTTALFITSVGGICETRKEANEFITVKKRYLTTVK